jgi:hypothetical protein
MSSGKFKRLVSAEAALKTLQAALEEEWTDEEVEATPIKPLPPELSDASTCLEWGRSVLAAGFRYPSVSPEVSQSDDDEYRMVARNGIAIPLAVQERMHADRLTAEQQQDLDIDVKE